MNHSNFEHDTKNDICSYSHKQDNYQEDSTRTLGLHLIKYVEFDTKSKHNSKLFVEILTDSHKNLHIFYYLDTRKLWKNGVVIPFSYFDTIYVCDLDGIEPEEYIISVADAGSTFGATTLVILWYWDISWHVEVTHFPIAKVEDVNNDGICEIVNYGVLGKQFYKHREIYRFKDGCFELLKIEQNDV